MDERMDNNTVSYTYSRSHLSRTSTRSRWSSGSRQASHTILTSSTSRSGRALQAT